ncbi:hypothetical protein pipiens_007237 [Culex pipiens pipiens]|uniref:Uncharacterized protein n=1 Tax=Culex pipiens pipiens TaxID=38569 RepID=A0ABD1DQM5_CULPP
MSRTTSLGMCVLCCLVVALIVEALEFDQQQSAKHSRPPATSATVKNDPKMLEYVPEGIPADNEHHRQHDKRDAMPRRPSLEDLLAQQWPEPPNLRGRRLPLYAEEPRFILLRQPTQQQQHHSSPSFSFIPQRGRKSDPLLSTLAKRELSIKQMLEGGDYFVPNRGKKATGVGISKKVKFDDILGSDELFIPNRGKKELFELLGGGGRAINELQPYYYNKKNVLTAIQNVGGKNDGTAEELFYPTRGKKANVLDNLAQNADTFFSSRGKRIPVAWNLLNQNANGNDDDPWEYLTAAAAATADDSSSYDADFALDRYQTNKIIA